MRNTKDVYVKRLAKCSVEELFALKGLVLEKRASLKCASLMLECIAAALMAKAGVPA